MQLVRFKSTSETIIVPDRPERPAAVPAAQEDRPAPENSPERRGRRFT